MIMETYFPSKLTYFQDFAIKFPLNEVLREDHLSLIKGFIYSLHNIILWKA